MHSRLDCGAKKKTGSWEGGWGTLGVGVITIFKWWSEKASLRSNIREGNVKSEGINFVHVWSRTF